MRLTILTVTLALGCSIMGCRGEDGAAEARRAYRQSLRRVQSAAVDAAVPLELLASIRTEDGSARRDLPS